MLALFFVRFVVRFEGAPEAEKKVWCDEGGRILGLGDRGEPSQQGDHSGSGSCRKAVARTVLWSATSLAAALPGRSSIATHSRVLATHAPAGDAPRCP